MDYIEIEDIINKYVVNENDRIKALSCLKSIIEELTLYKSICEKEILQRYR